MVGCCHVDIERKQKDLSLGIFYVFTAIRGTRQNHKGSCMMDDTVRHIIVYVTSDAVGRVWIDLCSRLVAVLGRSLIDLRRKGKCLLSDNEFIRASECLHLHMAR